MIFSPLGETRPAAALNTASEKKTDVSEHPEVFERVGLLANGPLGTAELSFI
jgi:hypothetical protein